MNVQRKFDMFIDISVYILGKDLFLRLMLKNNKKETCPNKKIVKRLVNKDEQLYISICMNINWISRFLKFGLLGDVEIECTWISWHLGNYWFKILYYDGIKIDNFLVNNWWNTILSERKKERKKERE